MCEVAKNEADILLLPMSNKEALADDTPYLQQICNITKN